MSDVVYAKTAVGQFLYDIAFASLTDKWIARKHSISIGEVRNVRKSPIITKLRKQVQRDRRSKEAPRG
jgi:hypothetical protein